MHSRVPPRAKHPPLPDIFLERIPRVPWAFQAVERMINYQAMAMLALVVFCPHRDVVRVLVRLREVSLMPPACARADFPALECDHWHVLRPAVGLTCFCHPFTRTVCRMSRCITMSVTNLPVPSPHLDCECVSGSPSIAHPLLLARDRAVVLDSWWAVLERAYHISVGLGLTVNGVYTCGDYIFSGHTILLTAYAYFLWEYIPNLPRIGAVAIWVSTRACDAMQFG